MSEPFMAEMRIMAFGFAPKGWAACNGQLMPINQNQALFSLLGTNYGGDGRVNFGLPDLRGRTPIGVGPAYRLGQNGGAETVSLTADQNPMHVHFVQADANTAGSSNAAIPAPGNTLGQSAAVANPGGPLTMQVYSTNPPGASLYPQTIGNIGASQPHENRQPFNVLNVCIALQGIFPSPN